MNKQMQYDVKKDQSNKNDGKNQKMKNERAYLNFLELEFLGGIEDSFDCAGFCKSPLFYFSKSTYHGYPEQTCLLEVIEYMKQISGPLATECQVIYITLILLFIMSFTLYGKQ